MSTATITRPASEKQKAFLNRLLNDRELPIGIENVDPNQLGVRAASALIDELLRRPHKAPRLTPTAPEPAAAPLEPGMYHRDGIMYRVQRSRESGNLYAKRLHRDGPQDPDWYFEYAPGVTRFLTSADRMTLEQAKAWGAEFGTCCVCAANLSDPKSVAAGIGPVCAKRV